MGIRKSIGIQFNLDKGNSLKPWISRYEGKDIVADAEHIKIEFGSKELKSLNVDDSFKMKLVRFAVRKYLAESSYSCIYTYIDASKIDQQLLGRIPENRIEVKNIQDKEMILGNYDVEFVPVEIHKVLKKSKLMVLMNSIFEFMAKRDFELDQELSLDIEYQNKNEWGMDKDLLRVSVQLEKLDE